MKAKQKIRDQRNHGIKKLNLMRIYKYKFMTYDETIDLSSWCAEICV